MGSPDVIVIGTVIDVSVAFDPATIGAARGLGLQGPPPARHARRPE